MNHSRSIRSFPTGCEYGSWVASRANWPRIGTMNRWLDAPISRSAQSVRASSRRGAGYLYSEVSDPVAAEVEETLALTPALSPRRGGSTHSSRDFSLALWWPCFTGTYVGCYSFDGLVTPPGRRTVRTDDRSPPGRGRGWVGSWEEYSSARIRSERPIGDPRSCGPFALLLVAGLLFSSCSRKEAVAGKPGQGAAGLPVPVLVATAVEKNVPVEITAIGNVQPFTKVAVRSQITGQLSRVHFQEGSEVRKGELLFTIDPRPAQAALDQAKANLARDQAQLENAQIEFARAQKLFESKISSQDDYDKARANLDALRGTVLADQAAITNAALNLEFTTIRSPVEGRTGGLLLHEGNVVKAEEDVLLQINQVRPIFVSFAVPEQFLPEVRRRMRAGPPKARANFVNLDGPPPQGQVAFIDNTVDPATGTVQLKATFENADNTLWPGQFVQVVLTLSEQANAVVVPTPAIQPGQNGDFVFVVKADQTVEMRPVSVGAARDGQTAVQSGVKPGETVVIDGQLRLVPGARVDAKPADTFSPKEQRQEADP